MTCPSDPETELPQLPGDPVDREIRLEQLELAWNRAKAEGWSGHVPKRSEGDEEK